MIDSASISAEAFPVDFTGLAKPDVSDAMITTKFVIMYFVLTFYR